MIGSDPGLVILAGLIKALRDSEDMEAAFAYENPDSPVNVNIWSSPPAAGGGEGAQGTDDYPFLEVADIEVNSGEVVGDGEPDGVPLDDPSEVFATLRAYSRPRGGDGDAATLGGRPEAMRLIKSARRVLSRDFDLPADEDGGLFRFVLAEVTNTRHITAPDGVTAVSVLTVRFEVEPSED